jgi:hypothetical protein
VVDYWLRLVALLGVSKETMRWVTIAILAFGCGVLVTEVFHQERVAKLKDDIEDYERRFGIVPAENKYENFTGAELRQRAAPHLRPS